MIDALLNSPRKGAKKPRFRKSIKWEVKNRVLYGLMMVEDIKVTELAAELEVDSSTVRGWIYHGKIPEARERQKLVDKFNLPQKVIFHEVRKPL